MTRTVFPSPSITGRVAPRVVREVGLRLFVSLGKRDPDLNAE